MEKIFKDIFYLFYSDAIFESYSKVMNEIFLAYKDIPYDKKESMIKIILKNSEIDFKDDTDDEILFEKFQQSKWIKLYDG